MQKIVTLILLIIALLLTTISWMKNIDNVNFVVTKNTSLHNQYEEKIKNLSDVKLLRKEILHLSTQIKKNREAKDKNAKNISILLTVASLSIFIALIINISGNKKSISKHLPT